MVVSLEDGTNYVLVDSVTYGGDKYFAATNEDAGDDQLYFFKLEKNGEEEVLEIIDQSDNEKVIDALIQHMKQIF